MSFAVHRLPLLCALTAVMLFGPPGAWGQSAPIPWRSGAESLSSSTKSTTPGALVVLQFSSHPTSSDREDLRRNGVDLLAYVGEGAWFARASQAKSLDTLPNAIAVADAQVNWKVEPSLLDGTPPDHVVLPSAAEKSAEGLRVAVYVLFFPPTNIWIEGADTVTQHGGIVHSGATIQRTLLCDVALSAIPNLAADPFVQWIEPALPAMTATNDSSRILIQATPLQQAPYNLNGSGVTAMILDTGSIDPNHPDFQGRLTLGDPDRPVEQHSTHVAGTVAGSGAQSIQFGGSFQQWRGMAPATRLLSYEYEALGIGEIFFADPGDIEDDYVAAIALGAHISNNSIGSNVSRNGYRCSLLGDYGITAALVDDIVRGSAGGPLTIVWSAGNERARADCSAGFATISPPSAAKNPIVVGAVNSDTDEVTSFSSWGPTDDGRVKPDVVAPGSQTSVDRGVTSANSGGGYATISGTSMAAPAVTGVSALLIQEYRRLNPGLPDPLNSTVKTLLIQGAKDNGNLGPDYRYGFGSVRAQRSIDILRAGRIIESTVADRGADMFAVTVTPGASELRATLGWDDPAAAPNVHTALVNDLDLVAISPGGIIHYPSTLNPALPETPAISNQPDRRNNVEQICVHNPQAGEWILWVRGHSVPLGPQPFSISASPSLATCPSQPQLRFANSSVSCEGRIALVLAHCQNNIDPLVADVAPVILASSADPTGMMFELVETGVDTGVFTADIPVSLAPPPGALLVQPGGAVSAVFETGGDPVVAGVTVDCTPPTFSGVAIAPTALTSKFNFSTSKPTRVSIRYGTACGALTHEQADGEFVNNHNVVLTGLQPSTTYFAVITAEDQAGNRAVSNRNGLCHTFTTEPAREYFTELLMPGSWDLDNSTLVLTPASNPSGYTAQRYRNVFYLPDDPAASTPVFVADDGSVVAHLQDNKRVTFFGKTYFAFFIGSNGYVTFTKGDDNQIPTFPDHFTLPRIAALFQDLDPSTATGSGAVSWAQYADHATVTWLNVQRWDQPENRATLQIRMYFNGVIEITWLGTANIGGIAGLSRGEGMPPEIVPSDLSAYLPGPLRLSIPHGLSTVAHTGSVASLIGASGHGGPITFSPASLPPGADLTPSTDGTALFTWHPSLNQSGAHTVTITARQDSNVISRGFPVDVAPYTHIAPQVITPHIEPVQPLADDDLTASYEYLDPDGFPESGHQILWLRNGQVQAQWNDAITLPAVATTAGDLWRFTIRVNDGHLFSPFATSPDVLIRHPFDTTGDGLVRAEDVQATINAVLSGQQPGESDSADINHDGIYNAVDIQLVILALLGLR